MVNVSVNIKHLKPFIKENPISEYKIKSIFIKALYQNISSPIDNRSIANNTALSTLVIT